MLVVMTLLSSVCVRALRLALGVGSEGRYIVGTGVWHSRPREPKISAAVGDKRRERGQDVSKNGYMTVCLAQYLIYRAGVGRLAPRDEVGAPSSPCWMVHRPTRAMCPVALAERPLLVTNISLQRGRSIGQSIWPPRPPQPP